MAKKTEEQIENKEEQLEAQNKEVDEELVWNVAEVPTQTEPMIVNTKTKEAYNILTALVVLLNKVDNIEKTLGV